MSRTVASSIEWPTLAITLIIYAGFGLVTWFHQPLPGWLVFAVGGYLVAWHGHLQHEILHGHPTRSRAVNEALIFPNLGLWFPYGLYRELHLEHHVTDTLTDPLLDPESYYLTPADWERLPAFVRALLWFQNTAAGRLSIGPLIATWRLLSSEIVRIARGDRSHVQHWVAHVPACSLTLLWVLGVCGIDPTEYLLLYVYPGISLTLLRSFLEHQARPDAGHRTVIVEAGPLMSLLYLNNNLHALHHAEPGIPWYRLKRIYAERRVETLAQNGSYCYRGYLEILGHYLFRAKEPVEFPLARS